MCVYIYIYIYIYSRNPFWAPLAQKGPDAPGLMARDISMLHYSIVCLQAGHMLY